MNCQKNILYLYRMFINTNNMKKTALLFCLALFCFSCQKQVTNVVDVEGGRIEGLEKDSLKIFKGIPFAAPPVGDLRWKAPQPLTPWDGVKKTVEFAKDGGFQRRLSLPQRLDTCQNARRQTPSYGLDIRRRLFFRLYRRGKLRW